MSYKNTQSHAQTLECTLYVLQTFYVYTYTGWNTSIFLFLVLYDDNVKM